MHTFFINTSKKEPESYDVLFDIHRENKTFVSIKCPLSDWTDTDKGFMSCARQMGEMIDGYAALNNAFDLIVYIDLLENNEYSSIERDAFYDKARDECSRALHILFTHVMSKTIVHELTESGRKPNNVLIMFGEQKMFAELDAGRDVANREGIMKRALSYIGLPNSDVITRTAIDVQNAEAEDKVTEFESRMLAVLKEGLFPCIRDMYRDELKLWYENVIRDSDVEGANNTLFDSIDRLYGVEGGRMGLKSVSCPYDRRACEVNKSERALSTLNIALHLHKCVEQGSIYDSNGEDVIPFRPYTANDISRGLRAKKAAYTGKLAELESMRRSYSELRLAPKLRAFDYKRFGLDVYGRQNTELVITEVPPEKEKKENKSKNKDDAAHNDNDSENDIDVNSGRNEVTVSAQMPESLFTTDEYEPFDYNFEAGREHMRSKHVAPDEYIKRAKELRKHHLDYLEKLKHHVSRVLSNYAGRSEENRPPLLRRGELRYATAERERNNLETVRPASDTAYDTVVDRYMNFCASRSVAVSDIEEQCNNFISRVNAIRASLKKIKNVALGLGVAIVVMYLPFVIIQFEAITENALTLTTALSSVALPLALLYFIFAIMSSRQKKKYAEAWKEFENSSDQVLEDNKNAVKGYDLFLSAVIPALRWVYEYNSDVKHYAACCDAAAAKLEHHKRKLRDRIVCIDNILSDLEVNGAERDEGQIAASNTSGEPEFNVPFCVGQKNRNFYSVFEASAGSDA